MNRQSIGETLSARLFAAETAIDAALTETAHLTAMLPAARAEAYLSAVTGQKAFDGAAASIVALTEARSHLVDTHNTLAALARRLGLEAVAVGALDKPEDDLPRASPELSHKVNKTLPSSLRTC
ncbi:MAG: hypothetical protein KJ824_02170 [Alphaproteobacteria bacterium]|nr:hypothetical protein [Alphaproteobacteria bacterium]